MEHFGNLDLLSRVPYLLPVGIWIMDASGTVVYGNPAGQRIWAGTRDAGPGQYCACKGWWRSSGEPIAPEEWAAARAIRRGETSVDEEIEIECLDGSRKIILNSAMPIHDKTGAVCGAVIVNVDITARIASENRMKELVKHDGLTGAYSRRKFYDLLGQEIQPRLVGGEEFMLILPETGLGEAAALAEKLRLTISARPCGPALRLTCSFGVAQYAAGEAADAFLQQIDRAMYRAKERGRNNVVIDLAD